MSADPVLEMMLQLYPELDRARQLLIDIGFPEADLPAAASTADLWRRTLPRLNDRVKHGRYKLVLAALREFPANETAAALAETLRDERTAIPEQLQRHPDNWPGQPTPPTGAGPPGGLADPVRSGAGRFPTLTVEGADLFDELEDAARRLFDDNVERLYWSPFQSAVLIPDPGERDEEVRRQVQDWLRAVEPACRVTFKVYPFRPYIYRELIVHGPDTTAYRLDRVPATMTPEDIAAELVAETRDAASGRTGLVRVVIDHERDGRSIRLDPYTTLHDCGVQDSGELRVAPDAIAGGILPAARVEAVQRALRAFRKQEQRDHRFVVAGCDDEVLPGMVTLQVNRVGLALPAGSPATGEPDPVLVEQHTVTVCFPDMFPLTAPRVVWRSPVFHPNIRSDAYAGLPVGTLQFHPLLVSWQPGFDCLHLAAVIGDVAAYRDYDLADGPLTPNPVAARWAGTPAGQKRITGIGGRAMADVVRQGDSRTRPPGLLLIRPLDEVRHGH